MAKGKRLFKCFDCGAGQMLYKNERSRATRPRCTACGSLTLLPHSEGAKEQVREEACRLTDDRRLPGHIKDRR